MEIRSSMVCTRVIRRESRRSVCTRACSLVCILACSSTDILACSRDSLAYILACIPARNLAYTPVCNPVYSQAYNQACIPVRNQAYSLACSPVHNSLACNRAYNLLDSHGYIPRDVHRAHRNYHSI